eukprot:Rhum_TRINITY_DN14731_c18_g1::Rhum_TRINITY_DN14731_c18_g1_i1::g.115420::m.115420
MVRPHATPANVEAGGVPPVKRFFVCSASVLYSLRVHEACRHRVLGGWRGASTTSAALSLRRWQRRSIVAPVCLLRGRHRVFVELGVVVSVRLAEVERRPRRTTALWRHLDSATAATAAGGTLRVEHGFELRVLQLAVLVLVVEVEDLVRVAGGEVAAQHGAQELPQLLLVEGAVAVLVGALEALLHLLALLRGQCAQEADGLVLAARLQVRAPLYLALPVVRREDLQRRLLLLALRNVLASEENGKRKVVEQRQTHAEREGDHDREQRLGVGLDVVLKLHLAGVAVQRVRLVAPDWAVVERRTSVARLLVTRTLQLLLEVADLVRLRLHQLLPQLAQLAPDTLDAADGHVRIVLRTRRQGDVACVRGARVGLVAAAVGDVVRDVLRDVRGVHHDGEGEEEAQTVDVQHDLGAEVRGDGADEGHDEEEHRKHVASDEHLAHERPHLVEVEGADNHGRDGDKQEEQSGEHDDPAQNRHLLVVPRLVHALRLAEGEVLDAAPPDHQEPDQTADGDETPRDEEALNVVERHTLVLRDRRVVLTRGVLRLARLARLAHAVVLERRRRAACQRGRPHGRRQHTLEAVPLLDAGLRRRVSCGHDRPRVRLLHLAVRRRASARGHPQRLVAELHRHLDAGRGRPSAVGEVRLRNEDVAVLAVHRRQSLVAGAADRFARPQHLHGTAVLLPAEQRNHAVDEDVHAARVVDVERLLTERALRRRDVHARAVELRHRLLSADGAQAGHLAVVRQLLHEAGRRRLPVVGPTAHLRRRVQLVVHAVVAGLDLVHVEAVPLGPLRQGGGLRRGAVRVDDDGRLGHACVVLVHQVGVAVAHLVEEQTREQTLLLRVVQVEHRRVHGEGADAHRGPVRRSAAVFFRVHQNDRDDVGLLQRAARRGVGQGDDLRGGAEERAVHLRAVAAVEVVVDDGLRLGDGRALLGGGLEDGEDVEGGEVALEGDGVGQVHGALASAAAARLLQDVDDVVKVLQELLPLARKVPAREEDEVLLRVDGPGAGERVRRACRVQRTVDVLDVLSLLRLRAAPERGAAPVRGVGAAAHGDVGGDRHLERHGQVRVVDRHRVDVRRHGKVDDRVLVMLRPLGERLVLEVPAVRAEPAHVRVGKHVEAGAACGLGGGVEEDVRVHSGGGRVRLLLASALPSLRVLLVRGGLLVAGVGGVVRRVVRPLPLQHGASVGDHAREHHFGALFRDLDEKHADGVVVAAALAAGRCGDGRGHRSRRHAAPQRSRGHA